MINVNQTAQILQWIEQAPRIICLTHANPDGDAVGSLLGLAHTLSTHYPQKQIVRLCKDPAPPSFHYLNGVQSIVHDVQVQRGDLVICLDAAEPKQTDLQDSYPEFFSPERAEQVGIHTIKIDHHPDGSAFAELTIIDPTSASTAELIVELCNDVQFPIDADTATCLLTGLYTDTGSMMHGNTSGRVYRTAARLVRAGADQQTIVEQVFRTSKVSTLKLWGRVLENISVSDEGAAVAALKSSDFASTGAHFSELTGAIDYVNSIPGMKFSMVLSERDGKVKGSLRTLKDDVDVAAMAQKFSGGGHKKAAGFSVEGQLEKEVRWKVVPKTD